jgi:hypothetical protein
MKSARLCQRTQEALLGVQHRYAMVQRQAEIQTKGKI